jgi:hypothetical protein
LLRVPLLRLRRLILVFGCHLASPLFPCVKASYYLFFHLREVAKHLTMVRPGLAPFLTLLIYSQLI